jgi:imidazolonepropionase-like amidohydrolase
MSLNKIALKNALQAAFEDIRSDKTAADAAQQLADAIDDYVKTGSVTFVAGTPIATSAGPGTITAPMTGNVQ